MANNPKRDNSNLFEKVDLRAHFIDRFHADKRFAVFDACQGGGKIWQMLRRRYDCEYWGVDVKAKKGRLAMDSVRVLGQKGFDSDVVDIDTQGSPWKHWLALLPNVRRPMTVFLTVGHVKLFGIGSASKIVCERAGLRFKTEMPRGLSGRINKWLDQYMLGMCCRYDLTPAYCARTKGHKTNSSMAQYLGVHLVPVARAPRG